MDRVQVSLAMMVSQHHCKSFGMPMDFWPAMVWASSLEPKKLEIYHRQATIRHLECKECI